MTTLRSKSSNNPFINENDTNEIQNDVDMTPEIDTKSTRNALSTNNKENSAERIEYTKHEINAARKALFSSIEVGVNIIDVGDRSNVEDTTRQLISSITSFTQLFVKNKSNHNNTIDTDVSSRNKENNTNNNNNVIIDGLLNTTIVSLKQQRKLLFDVVSIHFDKGHAGRFFSSLRTMVHWIIEQVQHSDQYFENRNRMVDDDIDNEFDNDLQRKKNSQAEHFDVDIAMKFLLISCEITTCYVKGVCKRIIDQKDTTKSRRSTSSTILICQEVVNVAIELHDVLLYLPTSHIEDDRGLYLAVQQKIVSLCEVWWINNCCQRESIITNALPILVQSALNCSTMDPSTTDATDSTSNKINKATTSTAIKRLYNVRTSIEAIDFQSPVSTEFTLLLLRLVSSIPCLNCSEGKRLIAYFLQIDPIFMSKVHQCIRIQIPNNQRQTILKIYGEIYYTAWKELIQDTNTDADHTKSNSMKKKLNDDYDDDDQSMNTSTDTSSLLEEYETNVIQDLLYSLIHAAVPGLSKALFIVLKPFHDNKSDSMVEDLLYRLYTPIIWRSLSAANSVVRMNAVSLLGVVFPLQESSHIHTNEAILKCCHHIHNLMKDPFIRTRISAAVTITKVLCTYWDVIPPDEIRQSLNLLMEHASDTSSADVRVNALTSFTLLLEINATHAVLRALLPKLGNLIHDKVEKVRASCVRMLLCIKEIPGIKYYHVVPVDHLIVRLELEGQYKKSKVNSVASLLSALMLNSYIPQNTDGNQQLERAIKFLKNDPTAAKIFYAHVHHHLELNQVSKLLVLLLRCLKTSIKNQNKGNASMESDARSNKKLCLSISVSADLAEVISLIWQSVEKDLLQDEDCKKFVNTEFTGRTLTSILSNFDCSLQNEDIMAEEEENKINDCNRICVAILQCATCLPSSDTPILGTYVTEFLKSLNHLRLQAESRTSILVSSQIALLCHWGLTDDVATSIASSIESFFEKDHELLFGSPEYDSKKRKCGRSNTLLKNTPFSIPNMSPDVAINILEEILNGSNPSSIAARNAILTSSEACHAIENALQRGLRHAEKLLARNDSAYSRSVRYSDATFIVTVCECYGRFVIHKEAASGGELTFSAGIERLLDWTTEKVVPSLRQTNVDSSSRRSNDVRQSDIFNDLNISSIAVETSYVGVSPIVTGPSRRRTNLSRTPIRFMDKFESIRGDENSTKEDSFEKTQFLSTALAISLSQSSCVLFAEWLAIGCTAGAETIIKSAMVWFQIIRESSVTTFAFGHGASNIEMELLPAFTRLAVEIFRSIQDTSLLKVLLVNCKDDDHCILRDSISSLLTTISPSLPNLRQFIEFILQVVKEMIPKNGFESWTTITIETTQCLSDIFTSLPSTISSVFEVLLNKRSACLELCMLLVTELNSMVVEGEVVVDNNNNRTLLYARLLLWFLCTIHHREGGENYKKSTTKDVHQMIRDTLKPTIKFQRRKEEKENEIHTTDDNDDNDTSNDVTEKMGKILQKIYEVLEE